MTRSSFFLLAFVSAAIVVGSLSVAANPGGGDGTQSIENTLAVQRAMLQARDYLYGINAEPQKAVEVLETNLPRINGDRKYLALLRDAYRSWIKELALANQTAQIETYQKRLKILEEYDGTQQGSAAPIAATTTQPATTAPTKNAAASKQVVGNPGAPISLAPTASTVGTKADPFDARNELKLAASGFPQAPSPGKSFLAKADEEFKQKHYASAKLLYEQANEADPKILGEKGRECWAYCQLQLIVDQVNRYPDKTFDIAKLESDVKNAVAVAPVLAKTGDDILGNLAKRRGAGSGLVARGSSSVAVKHLPRGANGWLAAETTNFRVYHNQTEDYAENVAQMAEFTRTQMSRKWFGKEGDNWTPKCDIYLHANAADYSQRTGQNGASPGHSRIDLDPSAGRVVVREIHLRCDNPAMLDAILPHEATHVVLAGQFGSKHVPRWADEGIAVLTEPTEKVQQHRKNLAKSLESRDLIPLRDLLQMDNYPNPAQISTFYAQSVALVDFLTKERGPVVLTLFIREGLQSGYEPALRKHYGYQSIAELQSRFTERMLAENAGAQPTFAGR